MNELAATLLVFLLAAAGLALGLLFGRGAVRGSCGGLSAIPGVERVCDCADPCPRKRRELEKDAERGKEPDE